MKKIISAFLTLLLCFQFITPIIAIAVTINGQGEVSLISVEMAPSSTKNEAKVTLTLDAETTQSEESVISVSSNFILKELAVNELIDEQGNVCGTYQVQANTIKLSIMSNINSKLVFSIDGGASQDIQDPRVLFSYGETSKELLVPSEWLNTISTEESSKTEPSGQETTQTTDSSTSTTVQKQQAYRAAMNVADIYASLSLPDNFLTEMNLTFEDANGNPVVEPTADDTIDFGFTFALPEAVRQLMQAGDYYTIQLPDTVKMAQAQSYPLSDENGIQYATVTIDIAGLVTVTFTDQVQQASDIHGEFHFTGKFNKITIGGPGRVIIIPATHEQLEVEVNIKPNYTGNNIAKAGRFDRVQNPSKIIWNVDINMGMDALNNAQVSEIFPVGTTYESVKVYQMQVDFSGKIIANSATLVDPSNYSVDSNGMVTFNSQIESTYRIEYTTTINDEKKPASGGQVSFLNKATLKSANVQDATAQATVSANYGKEITKIKGNYDSTKQIINWTLNYNYGEKMISNGVITDTFQNANMVLVAGSLKLYGVTFASNGTAIRGSQLIEGTDYQLVLKSDGFDIKFLHTIQTAVLVNYQTGYNGIVDTTIPIGNSVETTSGQTSSGTGSFIQQNVIKRLGAVDYNAQTVGWNISININQYTMNNWTFTDSASVGLTMQTATFKIYDQNTKKYLVAGQDYTFNYNLATRVTNVSFINNYSQTNHAFTISYTDDYDPQSNPSPDLKFVNNAHVEWTSSTGQTITGDDSQTFFPNNPTRYNGLKSGAYNAVNKQITWTIAIEYRDSVLQNGKIVDKLTAGQNYIPNSIKIYNYTIGTGGEIIKGSEITPTQYQAVGIQEPSTSNNQTLIINIPNNIYGKYLAEFKTSLENELVHKTYVNDAVFSNDNYQDYTLHAEVTVNHGDELVTKSGAQDSNGFVQWSATINGSQSTLYETTIVDVPSTNQAIDLNSVKLFETSVDQAGNITKGSQLVAGQDYTINLDTNNVSGQQTMTIKLKNNYLTLREALILNYQSMVFLQTNSGSVSNKINIDTKGTTQTADGRSLSVNVVSGSGGGSATGVRGLINIKKVNELGQAFPLGGTFELLDKNKNQVLRSGTVDATGLITFGALPYGTYVLRETNALTNLGYTISPELVNGIAVEITAGTTQGTPLVIQNNLGKVQLTKVSEGGKKLSNAEFLLEKYDPLTTTWSLFTVAQSLKTIADGTLTIKGLQPGKYRLIEKTAPSGYVLNTVPVEFDVVVNEFNQLVQQGMATPYVNYQGAISLHKTNLAGDSLQNSSFDLYLKGNETTVIQTATSDINGQVLFKDLGPGDYVIKEKTSSSGYIVNTTPVEVTVPSQSDKPIGTIAVASDFINYQGSAELSKFGTNSSGKVPLEGVQFDLEDETGAVVFKGTTGYDGKLKVLNIAPGTYYFVEKSVGSHTNYLLNSEKVKVVIEATTEGEPDVVQVEQVNYQGSVKLKKVNAQGTGIKNAEFTLYRQADDSIVKEGILSGNDGSLSIVDLVPGKYYLKETKAPLDDSGEQYILNDSPISFEIPSSFSGVPETIDLSEFQNFKGSAVLTKFGVSSSGNVALDGIQFDLENELGEIVRTGTTGYDGKLKVNNLSPGTYFFVEKSVGSHTDYLLNSEKVKIEIEANSQGEPALVEVEQFNYQGSIKLKKVNVGGTGLKEAEFTLYSQVDDSVVKNNILSGNDGSLSVVDLAPGKYYLKETKAPLDELGNQYVINDSPIPFEIPSSFSGVPDMVDLNEFQNFKGSAELTKYGINSTGKTPLDGVQFDLEDELGQVVQTGTTDSLGKIKMENLSPGIYYFVEKNVGSHTDYLLNSEKVKIVIAANSQGEPSVVKVEQLNYQGSVTLKKVNGLGAELKGAEFTLYRQEDNSVVKTGIVSGSEGTDGNVVVKDLAPGKYYLKETKAPVDGTGEEYIINEYPLLFEIPSSAAGIPETIDMHEFQNYKGKVGFKKVGSGDLPIAGAKFSLFEAIDNVEHHVKDIEILDPTGTIDIENLSPGFYKLIEIGAPQGYIKNLQPMYFTITPSGTGQPTDITVSIINYEVGIKVKKFSDKTIPDVLADATFEIHDSQGNVVDVYDKVNNIVKSFTTDVTGEVEVTGLPAGDYTLVETGAPTGYVRNTEGIPFKIEEVAGTPQHTIIDLGGYINYQGSIKVQKQDETGMPISGGDFELRDKDGNVVEVIDDYGNKTTKLTSINGMISATGLVPGDYYLVETIAPDGYVLEGNEKVLPITINQDGVGKAGATFVGEFTNYQGSVLLNKVSLESKKPLEHAVFDLYTKDGKTVDSSLKTNQEGQIVVDKLAPGEYYFIEKEAPKGYELSPEKQAFTINEVATGKPQQIVLTMTNKVKPEEPVKPKKPDEKEGTIGKFGEQVRNGLMIAGVVLVIAVIGYVIWKKKQKK